MEAIEGRLGRRQFLKAMVATAATCGLAKAAGAGKRLNVLLIAVDDLRPELGCFGVNYAQTPNIDRLASSGVRFTNQFVQVPTCGASRYAMLTGRSPAYSKVTSNNNAFFSGASALSRTPLKGAQTMPELFRRNGYHTVCIGKISHTPDGRVYAYNGSGSGADEVPGAWDELATPFGPWKRGWGAFFAYEGGLHREDGKGHNDLMEFKAEKDEDLPDGLLAKAAVEKLGQLAKRDQPFFMGVGFYKPHLPFVGTRGDWEAFADVDIPIAKDQEKPDSAYWHKSGEFYRYDAPFTKKIPLDPDSQLRSKRAYLACARYSDRQVGKVLRALDKLGLADNTVVVLWGDHGWHLGDAQLWGKHTPFERAVRSPLIVRAPGFRSAGRKCDALVETIDIYPTIVDLCSPSDRRTAHRLDGKTLLALLEDPDSDIREAAISYWGAAISVRTKTHRLIVTRKAGKFSKIELYDMRESPDPIRNIADEQPQLVKKMLGYIADGDRTG